MTMKMARSAPSTDVRAARKAGCRLHLTSALQEGRNGPNIQARSGVIRRFSVSTGGALRFRVEAEMNGARQR